MVLDVRCSNNGSSNDASTIKDAKHLFGFVWKNHAAGVQIERINGDKYYDQATPGPPATMEAFAANTGHV